MTDFISIDQHERRGCTVVHVFFDHRRTRSTVAMMRRDKLFTFEVRRSEAVALQTWLADRACERGHALAEFIGRWRQK